MTTSSKKEKQMVSSDLRGNQTWSTQDIVERLRAWADIHRHGARPGGDLMAEAADEIERLQQGVDVVHVDLCAENDNLRAEIERLRAELSGRARDDGTYVHRLDEREGDE
jgi:hypothetical protein